jgi:hypothetical protein
MSDAFDRWMEWRHKPTGDKRSIPAELYAAVMSLPHADRSDRQRVNEAVRHHDEARREGRTVWLYLDDYQDGRTRTIGEPGWIKVFASADTADRWFKENDPEGVAWEYEVDGGPAEDRSGSTRRTRTPETFPLKIRGAAIYKSKAPDSVMSFGDGPPALAPALPSRFRRPRFSWIDYYVCRTFSYFGRRNWSPLISSFELRGLQLVPSGPET